MGSGSGLASASGGGSRCRNRGHVAMFDLDIRNGGGFKVKDGTAIGMVEGDRTSFTLQPALIAPSGASSHRAIPSVR